MAQVIGRALLLVVIQKLRFLLPYLSTISWWQSYSWSMNTSVFWEYRKDWKGGTPRPRNGTHHFCLHSLEETLVTNKGVPARETWQYSWAAVAPLLVKDSIWWCSNNPRSTYLPKDCVFDKDSLSLSLFKETCKDRRMESLSLPLF